MKQLTHVIEGKKHISSVIDGDKLSIDFNGDKLHTDGETHLPHWNDKQLLDKVIPDNSGNVKFSGEGTTEKPLKAEVELPEPLIESVGMGLKISVSLGSKEKSSAMVSPSLA